jgi:hypothetical protein
VPEHVETKVIALPWDVSRRLGELKLTLEGLLRAMKIAQAERRNATEFHPANSAGTFSYHHGIAAIRREYVGPDWVLDRSDGIEAIRNDKLKVKLSFCNVDQAMGADCPKPRSDKGAGAERASGPFLFDDLKSFASRPSGEWALYYLMVDQKGAAELTRPVIARRTFTGAIERIFLTDGDDEEFRPVDLTDGIADGFDPQIVRR